MSKTQTKLTCEDYLHLPDDQRYELIEGELFVTPAPEIIHQRLVGKLLMSLLVK